MNSSTDSTPKKQVMQVAEPYTLVRARHGWMLANPSDFYLGKAILEYGEYGEIEGQFLRQLFFRPGAIVEVGANVGTHTVALARQAAEQQREMFAFEPQPFIFQNLCANLALNGISNVRAWPWACGANTETVYFASPDYHAPGNFGGVSMHATPANQDIAIPCVRLDDVLADHPVGLIKIDVEGFELETLQGAVDLLAASRPVLYLENDRLDKSQALIEWLWSQDYRLWWHIPPLFNPDNFFGIQENIYGNVASFNMLALPRESEVPVNGLIEVTDATYHPLRKESS
ncbi:FkbM family methyltransferase [Caballeronia glebae]|uniref:FkbM family methyltransferase n=1 Tax=Caballeronia glebae TaxID=1777143 RepID=UPI0038B9863B